MNTIIKKTSAALLALALIVSAAACGGSGSSGSASGSAPSSGSSSSSSSVPSTPSTPAVDSMALTDIMADILDGVEELPKVGDIEITDENFQSYLFIQPIDGAQALASEAMVSAIAHSVVLLRLPESADAAAVADEIKKNADPRKWICVEAESTVVRVQGSTVLLVMSDTAKAEAIAANFDALYA